MSRSLPCGLTLDWTLHNIKSMRIISSKSNSIFLGLEILKECGVA